MFKEHTINNAVVKPFVDNSFNDPDKVKGSKLFSDPYNNIFICSKRKSGKTSVIGKILLETTNKKSVIWLFCPTASVDTTWKTIINKLEDRGNVVNTFDDIKDGKIDQLDVIINDLMKSKEEPEKPQPQQGQGIKPILPMIGGGKILTQQMEEEKKKKEYIPKKISPENVFVFDDISHSLKAPSIYKILKNGRHSKSRCILSFQYANDLLPQGWKQCQNCLIFKSFSRDKLDHLYRMLDLTIPIDIFYNLYDYVMKDKGYDFLYIDVKDEKFRKNFNKEIEIDEDFLNT